MIQVMNACEERDRARPLDTVCCLIKDRIVNSSIDDEIKRPAAGCPCGRKSETPGILWTPELRTFECLLNLLEQQHLSCM